MAYKRTGRKLSKSKEGSPLMRSIRKRTGKGYAGHGKINTRKLSDYEKKQLRTKGSITVTVGGTKKKITKQNVANGRIQWYRRSDTKKIAVTRPGSDKKRASRHKKTPKKPFVGD